MTTKTLRRSLQVWHLIAPPQLKIYNMNKPDYIDEKDFRAKTKITFAEKVALIFIEKQVRYDPIENSTLVYKIYKGKVYVLDFFVNPPNHANCRSILNMNE